MPDQQQVFGPVVLTVHTGGVAGGEEVVRLEPSSVVTVTGRRQFCGRVPASEMEELKLLLTGADIVTEAATDGRPVQANDTTFELRMGTLRIFRAAPVTEDLDDIGAPAFRRVLTILNVARDSAVPQAETRVPERACR